MNLTLGPPGRRRTALITVIVVALVGIAVLTAKTVLEHRREDRASRAAARNVYIEWTLDCPRGLIKYAKAEDDMFDGPIIQSHGRWRCGIDLAVYNESSRDLRVTRIATPFLGSEAGSEMIGYSTPEAVIRDTGFGIDAEYVVDLRVRAKSEGQVMLAIGRRPRVCNGATFGFPEWPRVTFQQSGRTFHVNVDQDLQIAAFQNRENAAYCDDLGDVVEE